MQEIFALDWQGNTYRYERLVSEKWDMDVLHQRHLAKAPAGYVKQHVQSGDWWTVPVYDNASSLLFSYLVYYSVWNHYGGVIHLQVPFAVPGFENGYVGFLAKSAVNVHTLEGWLRRLDLVDDYVEACRTHGVLIAKRCKIDGLLDWFLEKYGTPRPKAVAPALVTGELAGSVPLGAVLAQSGEKVIVDPHQRESHLSSIKETIPKTNGFAPVVSGESIRISLKPEQVTSLMYPVGKVTGNGWAWQRLMLRLQEGITFPEKGEPFLDLSRDDAESALRFSQHTRSHAGYQKKLATIAYDLSRELCSDRK